MRCSNCNSEIKEGDLFCGVCGTKVVNINNNNNNISSFNSGINNNNNNISSFNSGINNNNNNNNISSFNNDINTNNISSFNSGINNNTNNISSFNNGINNNTNNISSFNNGINNNFSLDHESLLDIYIGNNSDKIKKGGFSFCTLLFGVFYTIYRKMWLFSLIWYLFNIVLVYLLKGYANIVILFISIIVSIKFKDLYINFASKNINKIKNENQFKSQNEIRDLCRKKGGVSVGILIIFIVLYFAIQIISVWSVYDSSNKEVNTDNNIIDNNNSSRLKVNIPSGFEPSKYNDENYQNFRYNDDETYDYCSFNYSISKYNRDEASDYLKRTVYTSLNDKVSDIEKKVINGNEWYFINVVNDFSNTYYYAIIYDGITYKLEYNMSNDPCDYCTKSKNNIINSIKFK